MAFIASYIADKEVKIYNSRNYMAFIARFIHHLQIFLVSTIVEIIWLL